MTDVPQALTDEQLAEIYRDLHANPELSGVNVRTFDATVRKRTLAAIERIVQGEAQTSEAPRAATIDHVDHFPALVNDVDGVARTRVAFQEWLGADKVIDPGVVTASEDVGFLAQAAGVPCVFWYFGGADPAPFAAAKSPEELLEVMRGIPSNHSPHFAPAISPRLTFGVEALLTAVRAWLPVTASSHA